MRWFVATIALGAAFCATACERSGFVEAPVTEGLDVTRVVASAELVQPGQQRLAVHAHLYNRSQFPLTEVVVRLRFLRGEADLSSYFAVEAALDNAAEMTRAEGAVHSFWVDVFGDAEPGPLTIDASVRALLPHGDEVGADSAIEPASIELVSPEAVVITVADDEDDIGEGEASVASAGGLVDISLREALKIVNAAGSPQTIRFDPAQFPPRASTKIELDPDLGLLPPIVNAETVIDGSGSSAVIDGSDIDDGSGLVLQAHGITLQKITMRGFNGGEHFFCVKTQDADRVQILDSTFIGCGTNLGSGAQVTISGGRDHLVSNCDFTAGRRDGLHVVGGASSSVISGNRMIGNADDGFEVTGSGHLVTDNLVMANGGHGSESGSLIDSVISDNQFLNNGGSGFYLHAGSVGLLIEACDFSDNGTHGVELGTGNIRVTVSRCSFRGNGDEPISVAAGSNESVVPPATTSFDGGRIEGTSSAEGGSVDIYSYGAVWEYVTSTPVAGGVWSLDLPSTQPAVVALVTTASGSSSAFSDYVISGSTTLVVSTLVDELDGGEGIVTIAEAGGVADLSLREAIILANNWIGPNVISFSPQVFPPAGEATIYLGSAFDGQGPLPLIRDAATEIDGAGAGVVLDGGRHPFPANTGALTFNADDCAVRDITIRNYNSPGGACVYNRDEDRLLVSGCTLQNCGGLDSGAGVVISGSSSGNLIVGNSVSNSHRAILTSDTSNSVIDSNVLSSKGQDCVKLDLESNANTVIDNWIFGCGDSGIELSSDSNSALIIGNRIYDCDAAAIVIGGGCDNVELVFNTAVASGRGMVVHGGDAVLRNNIVAHNNSSGIELGAEVEVTADHNLFFDNDGDGLSGSNAIMAETEPDAGVYEALPLAPSDVVADPMLVDLPGGVMTPGPAAVDVGMDLGYDRNGQAPGLFNGLAPDLGAVEIP